jgi:hypothetical protein
MGCDLEPGTQKCGMRLRLRPNVNSRPPATQPIAAENQSRYPWGLIRHRARGEIATRGLGMASSRKLSRTGLGLVVGGLVLLTGSVSPAAAGVRVELIRERATVHATAEPASSVLAALARAAGFQVSYQGEPPQDPVTVDLESLRPDQAVNAILEGLGYSYAIRYGPRPGAVELLIVDAAHKMPGGDRHAATQEATQDTSSPAGNAAAAEDASPELQAAVESGPPLPPRPPDLPTSPFIRYDGPLNPSHDGSAETEPGIPVTNGIPATRVAFPERGEVVRMDGMGPNGVPRTELKERLPDPPPPDR